MHNSKPIIAYSLLLTIVICGLATAMVTANKIVHFGVSFSFANIVFAICSFPIIDCICELWGKQLARQTVYLGLMSQIIIAIFIRLSINAPYASYWPNQAQYQLILASSLNVTLASVSAFTISQILDVMVYQKMKRLTHGRMLWLRSLLSTGLGQTIDTIIFINVVFSHSQHKLSLLAGSMLLKLTVSCMMIPVSYLIVFSINQYLNGQTNAFSNENNLPLNKTIPYHLVLPTNFMFTTDITAP